MSINPLLTNLFLFGNNSELDISFRNWKKSDFMDETRNFISVWFNISPIFCAAMSFKTDHGIFFKSSRSLPVSPSQILRPRDGDSSPWTRTYSSPDLVARTRTWTRVPHIRTRHETCGLDSDLTSGLGPNSANCAAEDSVQVHLNSNVETRPYRPTVDSTRLPYFTNRNVIITSWQNIITFHYCGRFLELELGNFRSLGFGFEPQTPVMDSD